MKNYIIPIFIPHYGCTHQCIFCNQKKITGTQTPVTASQVLTIIREHLSRITQPRHIEVAFYGGSFTALPLAIQQELLAPAYDVLNSKGIDAIRLSTRPDAITAKIVQNLIKNGVSIVELGVQSMDKQVLQAAARGHSDTDVVQAVKILKSAGITCGLQLMPGLPLEDWLSLTTTASKVVALAPDFIRIYPAIVIADTHMAKLYQQGLYRPLSLQEAVKRSAFLKLLCEQQGINVIRTGLQPTEELASEKVVLAGPFHPAFGEIVDSYLFDVMFSRFIEYTSPPYQQITIHHHPRDHSKVRGMKNRNIKRWQHAYNVLKIKLVPDGGKLGELVIEHNDIKHFINPAMLFSV